MSLESFLGMDQGEGMSAASLEQLRERMRAAAAQIAAIRREEKKHKTKEIDLIKILLKFIRTSQKTELVLLVSRALEQNIPANFILAIILLANEDIQHDLGTKFLMPPASGEQALTFFTTEDQAMPLKVKIELDEWMKSLLVQADENPHKLVKTAYKHEYIEIPSEDDYFDNEKKYEEKKYIHPILIQLTAFVIDDYLQQNAVQEPFEKTRDFAEFILKGIVTRTEDALAQRHLLE